MRGRSETNDQQPRGRIAEAGHRASPIHVVTVGTLLLERDVAAVVPQAWTSVAGDDLVVNEGKRSELRGPTGSAEEKVRRKAFHRRSPGKYNERLSLSSYAGPEESVSSENADSGGRRVGLIRGRHRWSHLDLCLGCHAVRSCVQPLLQGQGREPRRRHHLLPGSCGARDVRARVSRGTHRRPAARELPSRVESRRGIVVVSPPV